MYTITEKIHHGNYIARCQVTGDGLTSTPRSDFEDLIENSPYYSHLSPTHLSKLWLDLRTFGETAHGWATYTLTETDD